MYVRVNESTSLSLSVKKERNKKKASKKRRRGQRSRNAFFLFTLNAVTKRDARLGPQSIKMVVSEEAPLQYPD